MTKVDWQAIEAKLISRANEDEAFRKTLLKNPRAAIIMAQLGIPENVEFRVVEESAGSEQKNKPGIHYIILPGKSREKDKENEFQLSEGELEVVVAARGSGINGP